MRLTFLWIFAAVLLVSCAGKSKKADPLKDTKTQSKESPAFDRGLKELEQENYSEAAHIFDKLLVQKPASELDLVTLYNSGAAYEGLGECQTAADRYRQLVRSFPGKFPRIEGQAFYRLSLMYECLGQDAKAVTALLDATKRGKSMPPETIRAEIPARLAAAYARMGNRERALKYFTEASQGLKTVISKGGGRVERDLLSRTLFLMGQLNNGQRRGEGDPATYMQSISMQQPYLLQAAEVGHPVFSKKAADDLLTAYDNIWRFKITDPDLERTFYTRGLQVIGELKKIRLPSSNELVNEIFAKVDKTELQLQNQLAQMKESTKLTPEAEQRQGLKREGRIRK